MFQRIRRREFIAGLGGAAILPLLVHAQHPGKVKQFTQP
jgi:hypothetical protein